MSLRNALSQGPPNCAGAATQRKAKAPVRPPGNLVFLETDGAQRFVEGWGRNAFTNPAEIQFFQRMSPDLKGVRAQEQIGDSGTECRQNPFAEIIGLLPARIAVSSQQ